MTNIQADAKPIQHGKYSTYVLKQCRCNECKAANAAHSRAYRAERKARAESSK